MATCNFNSSCNIVVDNDETSNLTIDRKRKAVSNNPESASEDQAEPSPTKKKRALPITSPKFTVTYSRLCDGGTQEMSTAVAAVRDIFPDATIRTNRRNQEEDIGISNPSVVISATTTILGGSGIGEDLHNNNSSSSSNNHSQEDDVLWSSKQRNLYQKYPKKRRRSIKDIRKKLETLKTALQTIEPKPPTAVQAGTNTTTTATSQQVSAPARKVSLEHETRPADIEHEGGDCSVCCPNVR
jgi:hypothetical protein